MIASSLRNARPLVVLCLALAPVAACRRSDSGASASIPSTAATGPAAVPSPAPSAPAPAAPAAAAPQAIQLEDTTVAQPAVTIRLPRGARVLDSSEMQTTYSLTLPDGMNEINVAINAVGESSLARARDTATMMGGQVAESRALENNRFEVVLQPQGPIQSVSVFARNVSARCTVPADQLALAREICGSLRPRS